MVLGAVLLVAVLLVGGFIAGYQLVDIPAANSSATAQSNVYLYRDGAVIARDGDVNRENVRLAQVPEEVQHAVLAAEDRNFYSERAVDVSAMFRAAWNTVTGKGRQGGSTITQQYVKNYYLGQEQTVVRKAKEFFIAIKLDREQTKDQIFEGYLNTSYFGRNAYGIQAAAQAYYGKDVGDVDVAEGAYLASLLNAPSAYDVVAHPENSRPSSPAGSTCSTGWSRRSGSAPRHARPSPSRRRRRPRPPPASPGSAATSSTPSGSTSPATASSTRRPSPPAATGSPPPWRRRSRTPSWTRSRRT